LDLTINGFGDLRRNLPGGAETVRLNLPEGLTVDGLVGELGIQAGDFWFATVNGVKVDGSHSLQDGDSITLFSPVGGG
jgi:sulfur carrier protein ThiS